MPGKASEGFTKSAQNAKFIRHRDCKLKDGEQKKEDHIARVMCEGVCRRCREKSQWRFKYDKYKPLKKPASCSVCKNKTITKAYRTMCDACASKAKKCSSCCISLAEAHKADAALEAALDAVLQSRGGDDEEDEEDETEFGCVIQSLEDTSISTQPVKVASSSSAAKSVSKATEGSDDEDEEEEEEEEAEEDGNDEANENEEEDDEEGVWEDEEEGEEGEAGDDQDSDGEEISDDEHEGDDTFTVEETPVTVFGALTKNKFVTTTSMSDNISVASEVSINAEIKLMDVMWDERKFNNMATSKYSKNRVVGKEDGQIY